MTDSMREVPAHYRVTIRRLIRFGLVGIAIGLLLGFVWTEFRKSIRYGAAPAKVERVKGSRVRLELPPGMMFETALDLKLSHGHVTLLAGLMPLAFALALHLSWVHGGKQIRPGTLKAFFWMYVPGAASALVLMVYKGLAGLLAVRGGNFDLGAVDAALFGGIKGLRAACYGLSHTVMAVGMFIIIVAVYRSLGAVGADSEPDAEPVQG